VRAAVPLVVITCVLLAVGVAASRGASSRTTSCRDVRHAAAYYRTWTWRWQDAAQVPRDTHGYRPGIRVRSCSHARALARSWHLRARFWRLTVNRFDHDVRAAIRAYFGSEADGAITVAHCETGGELDNPYRALNRRNGWYGGIYQMGDGPGPGLLVNGVYLTLGWEIQRYGRWRGKVRYSTVADQVAAAARMYRDRGWGAWSCRPDGSVAY
jgi:hypothetical protein